MKARPLMLVGADHPLLRQVATHVPDQADRTQLVAQMFETMRLGQGVALAAPQVGVSERIIIGHHPSFHFVLLNPEIVQHGKDRQWLKEGCLSLPGTFVGKKRYALITVQGYDLAWNRLQFKARKLFAQVVQHEIDHLNGILMTDPEPST